MLVKVQCEVGAVSLETFAVSCLEFVPHQMPFIGTFLCPAHTHRKR